MAWRFGQHHPYALYHSLTPQLRPMEDPEGEPRPPLFPWRVKLFIYGLGMFANEVESQTGGGASGGRTQGRGG